MRKCGVLIHISSLPSPHGIGTLGAAARRFIDFLAEAGQSFWQVLPVSPTGFGDSPYQSFSSCAGNPYFIDPDALCEAGLLRPDEFSGINWGDDPEKADYGRLWENRYKVLSLAARRLLSADSADFDRFCAENGGWLEDYALFMALKDKFGGAPLAEWPGELRLREASAVENARRELEEAVSLHKAMQFFFYSQWDAMKAYANEKGLEIIGDIPIYAAADSADIWARPDVFLLDEELRAREVAGCPPDAFTEDGQLWGNPLYDWDALKAEGFDWWVRRIDHQFRLFDLLRIDHFRGLDSYFAIPANAENARHGIWRKGPGIEFFEALGPRRVIAEDLGFLTDSVHELLRKTGYPGMRVIQFAFDGRDDNEHLPRNFPENCVAYAGTHDNSTTLGWFKSAPESEIALAKKYLSMDEGGDSVDIILDALWNSAADTVIASMQDLLGLDDTARMNTPGTSRGNWLWRMSPSAKLDGIGLRLWKMTRESGRLQIK